jgi:hypothetical protein
VQILRQLPNTRARMVRGIVANEAWDGSTPFARSNLPRPAGANPGIRTIRPWWNRQTRSLEGTVLQACQFKSGRAYQCRLDSFRQLKRFPEEEETKVRALLGAPF